MEQKQADPFYLSKAWRRVRAEVLQRDHGICQECLREFRRGYGMRPEKAVIVHHIIPRSERPDLELDMSNLESICEKHHNKEHPEKGMTADSRRKAEELKTLTRGVRIIKI